MQIGFHSVAFLYIYTAVKLQEFQFQTFGHFLTNTFTSLIAVLFFDPFRFMRMHFFVGQSSKR